MDSFAEVRSFIMSSQDLEGLREINQVLVNRIKRVRTIQSARAAQRLNIGTRVRFETGRKRKYPAVLEGDIIKVAQKYCTVSTSYGNWRIPMSDVTVL